MEKMQQVFVLRAILDGDWQCDRDGRQRVMSAAQLEAIGDFRWPLAELRAALVACARSLRAARPQGIAVGPADSPLAQAETQPAA